MYLECFLSAEQSQESLARAHVETQLERGWCVVVEGVHFASSSSKYFLGSIVKTDVFHKHVALVLGFWCMRAACVYGVDAAMVCCATTKNMNSLEIARMRSHFERNGR